VCLLLLRAYFGAWARADQQTRQQAAQKSSASNKETGATQTSKRAKEAMRMRTRPSAHRSWRR